MFQTSISFGLLSFIWAVGLLPHAEASTSRLAELILHNRAIQRVLIHTDEGAAIVRRINGAEASEVADLERMLPLLETGAYKSFPRELELRLRRVESKLRFENRSGVPRLRQVAGEELRFDASPGKDLVFLPSPADATASSFRQASKGFLAAAEESSRLAVMASLKVAAVQYPVRVGVTLESHLARVEKAVRDAKRRGAQLVVFPELAMYELVSPASALSESAQLARIAREETPRILDHAAELSAREGVAILAGSAPRVTRKGIVNTAMLVFPDGKRVLQDKLFLTPDEVAWGWKAGSELKVFDAPWGRSTILICYDSQFPALSHALSSSAPDLVLVPSMTGAKGFSRVRWASQARAIEQHAYVVVTGTISTSRNAGDFVGQAAFLTPQEAGFAGLARSGPKNRSTIVDATLDFDQLRKSKLETGLYSGRDQGARRGPVRVVFE